MGEVRKAPKLKAVVWSPVTLEAKVRKGEVVAEALFRKPQAPGLVAAALAVGTSALLPGKPLPWRISPVNAPNLGT